MTALPSKGGDLFAAIRAVVKDDGLNEDPDVLETYRHDQARTVPAGHPLAVARPRTSAEVARVLRIARDHAVPVVLRGAGTGLSGAANALDGCIVLSTSRMNKVVAINDDDLIAVVEPGVINGDLARLAAEHGLLYPPDPASRDSCTIGGNVATNAGGLCCVRYGVTGDYVLEMEIALPDGSLTNIGRRTVKGVAGYDLARLLVGSEGTLAVVTQVSVRLVPAPPPPATVVASFPTLTGAGHAVASVTKQGVVPSMLEIMDRTTLEAVENHRRMDLDLSAEALLIVQAEAGSALHSLDSLRRCCEDAGADFVAVSSDLGEAEQLTMVRRLAYPSLEHLGATLLDDVGVPRSRVPTLLTGIQRIAQRHDLVVGVFGHAGDGNMHPTIVYDQGNEDSTHRALQCFIDITQLALGLGGTITGEHGIGALKSQFLDAELGPVTNALNQAVKHAFDPTRILNPGRAIV